MAIKLPDGRIMRTLPEQVDKNMQDIASINNEVNVIKESITTAYKIQGSATVADLNANTPDAAMNGYVYNMTDAGSLINSDETTTSVQIGDNVVLVWNDGSYFWDRLSGVVDTSNLVTLDSEQTITGEKSFQNDIYVDRIIFSDQNKYLSIFGGVNIDPVLRFYNGLVYSYAHIKPINTLGNYDLGDATHQWRDLYLSNSIVFSPGQTYYGKITVESQGIKLGTNVQDCLKFSGYGMYAMTNLAPNSNNGQNLGTPDNKWKNFYIQGNITDGTNSVTVAQISKTKLYNHQMTVSNVTGPVNVILTHNTPITGSFGANISSQFIISAYLTAQSNASQMKTPGGSLAQINNDGTITITVSSGATITDDTVTEL